jgi:hypothetical protein
MKITLTKHGGHTAGMRMPARTIDIGALDQSRAEELTRLTRSAVSSAPAAPNASDARESTPRAAPDAMSYTITVDEDGKTTTLKATDVNMSSSFAKLLDYVEQLT